MTRGRNGKGQASVWEAGIVGIITRGGEMVQLIPPCSQSVSQSVRLRTYLAVDEDLVATLESALSDLSLLTAFNSTFTTELGSAFCSALAGVGESLVLR